MRANLGVGLGGYRGSLLQTWPHKWHAGGAGSAHELRTSVRCLFAAPASTSSGASSPGSASGASSPLARVALLGRLLPEPSAASIRTCASRRAVACLTRPLLCGPAMPLRRFSATNAPVAAGDSCRRAAYGASVVALCPCPHHGKRDRLSALLCLSERKRGSRPLSGPPPGGIRARLRHVSTFRVVSVSLSSEPPRGPTRGGSQARAPLCGASAPRARALLPQRALVLRVGADDQNLPPRARQCRRCALRRWPRAQLVSWRLRQTAPRRLCSSAWTKS